MSDAATDLPPTVKDSLTTQLKSPPDSDEPILMNERSLLATLLVATLCVLEILSYVAYFLNPAHEPPQVSQGFTVIITAAVSFMFGQNSKTK